ncbi:NFACT RNA binding domain-containing protein [Treponema brennaborense]|uniref:Rqc2 homolog RqcH n=1 Tax=Treponema brennaborense (strain DSM 12168 / CIP 105900 / DD5/3) TaxID=906968 RepID=F4LPT0_TREBD|nr:NFACT family protein [Treponema brennaborense]AEE16022.1 Fibronectin-binding A domain protein [Treponema brennaborense DSM 12168]
MSLNWKEIDAVLAELDLTGSFIQQIVQPGFDSIALYTYKAGTPKTVLVCLAGGACRIHETKRSVPKNDKPLRFMEFLKSRVKGARIASIGQLGSERIIKAVLTHAEQTFFLYIRLWSGAANIVLTDEYDVVLDSFYRRPARGEVTGGTFSPPAAAVPADAAAVPADTADTADAASKPPRTAARDDRAGRTVRETREIRTFAELENADGLSLNEKIDRWYGEHSESLSRSALLEQAAKFYRAKRSRMENALHRLEKKREEFLHAEKWKHYGDVILAYGHLIDGTSDYLECEDYENGGTLRIKINAAKRAQENAADYYAMYKKSVSGLEDLEYDIQKAKRELLDLDAAYETVCREANPIKMQQLLRKQTKPKQQIEKKRPGITYELDGWTIFAGRTAAENDELLRRHVKGQDMWLHARDYAGGYVFVKNRPGKSVPLEVLLCAANVAVYHSKARKAGKADLYYTQVKYLRRAKNAPKGTVLPAQEKNLFVELDKERLKRMEESIVR